VCALLATHGKCHCGNISFSLTWEPSPAVDVQSTR
jgi:hypothetical protein